MKVVFVKRLPDGPRCDPIDCSSKHGIAPVCEQLESDPAGIDFSGFAQTTLLSKELCQVGLPKGRGVGAFSLGLVSGLRKCVMAWTSRPKIFAKSVASGRLLLTVQDAPVLVGRQT